MMLKQIKNNFEAVFSDVFMIREDISSKQNKSIYEYEEELQDGRYIIELNRLVLNMKRLEKDSELYIDYEFKYRATTETLRSYYTAFMIRKEIQNE